MKVLLYEVEYQCKYRRKLWREKRIRVGWQSRIILILAKSRYLAIKAYLRRTRYEYNRKMVTCKRWTGISRCNDLLILDSTFSISVGFTYEAIVRKVKSVAPVIVGNAVRSGQLIKPNKCSICGCSSQIEGHHPDYNEPLQVEWVCHDCHRDIHKRLTKCSIDREESKRMYRGDFCIVTK